MRREDGVREGRARRRAGGQLEGRVYRGRGLRRTLEVGGGGKTLSLTENTHIDTRAHTHTRTRGTRTLAPSLDYGSLKQTVPVVVFLEGLDAKVTLEGCYWVIDMRMTPAFRSSQMVLSLLERTGFNFFSVFSGK